MSRSRLPSDPNPHAKKQAQKIANPDTLIGPVRAAKLTREQQEKIAKKPPVKRWEKATPRG